MKNVKVNTIERLVTIFGFTLPVLPILLFMLFFYLPRDIGPYVLSLGGTWEARVPGLTTNIELPGLFINYGISAFDVDIRKQVALRDTMTNDDLFLTVFGTIFQTGIITVNGHLVGQIGAYGMHRKLGNIQGMDGFFIQKEFLTRTNDIRLKLQTEDKQSFGIQDPRFYLGVSKYLKPYFEKNLIVNNVFLYGILFFSLFMLLVIVILAVNGWNGPSRNKYIVTGNYILLTFLFNLFFSGVFISYYIDLGLLTSFLNVVITLFVWSNMEFVQYYYQDRIDRVGIVNRAVCFLAVALYLFNMLAAGNNNDFTNWIYNVFSVYILFSFGYSLFLVVKSVIGKKKRYGTIVAFSILMTILTALSDLLSNFGLIKFPLVFSVTASSVSIIATIVIIADFIAMSDKNLKLTNFLRKSNLSLREMIRRVRRTKMIEYDMAMASKIQSALLPQAFPDNDFISAYGNSIPAKQVGGDYYDMIPIGENKYLFAIADVMGKGMSASLVMVKVQTLLRALSGEDVSLTEIGSRINGIITRDFQGERFVTLSLFLYDRLEKKAEYAIFGHEPFFIQRKEGRSLEIVENRSLPLGIEEKMAPSNGRPMQFQSGDRVVFFTDGVTDVQNEKEEFFGKERFKKIVLDFRERPIAELYQEIIRSIVQFRGAREQSDDITLLMIELK